MASLSLMIGVCLTTAVAPAEPPASVVRQPPGPPVMPANAGERTARINQLMLERRSIDRQIAALQSKKDSLGELSEEDQLKLQTLTDRRTKAIETLSNLMKQISGTAEAITDNHK